MEGVIDGKGSYLFIYLFLLLSLWKTVNVWSYLQKMWWKDTIHQVAY